MSNLCQPADKSRHVVVQFTNQCVCAVKALTSTNIQRFLLTNQRIYVAFFTPRHTYTHARAHSHSLIAIYLPHRQSHICMYRIWILLTSYGVVHTAAAGTPCLAPVPCVIMFSMWVHCCARLYIVVAIMLCCQCLSNYKYSSAMAICKWDKAPLL